MEGQQCKIEHKEQLNNAVFFEAEGYKKMEKEIPKTKVRPLPRCPCPLSQKRFLTRPRLQMISASIISDRLKVNMSVARRAMAELVCPLPHPCSLSSLSAAAVQPVPVRVAAC